MGAPSDDAPDPEHEKEGESPEAIDFSTFVISLSTSALVNLGAIPSPEGGFAPADRHVAAALARQTIDILGMLEQKTRGNLTGDEERLLHEALVDLRIRCACSKP